MVLKGCRSLLVVTLLLQAILHAAIAIRAILSTDCSSSSAETACLNLGPKRQEVGPFQSMARKVILPDPAPTVRGLRGSISGTSYPDIFRRHFRESDLQIRVQVAPLRSYDVELHSLEAKFCGRGGVDAFIQAGTNGARSPTVNGLKSFGCRTAFTITASDARSDSNGLLQIRIRGNRAVIAGGVCVKRKLMEATSCSQSGCESFEGCGALAIAKASLAIPGAPCDILDSAQDTLNIPEGAQIAYAALNWAGAGHPRTSSTSIVINGRTVVSDLLHQDSQFEPYYTAMADVTELVRQIGRGEYVVTSLFHSPYLSCPQAHLAAWSLTVIYGALGTSADGSKTRVNVCARNSVGSPPLLTLPVKCVLPAPPAVQTTGSFVVFEGEFFEDEFYVNGLLLRNKAFQGRTGEKFDVFDSDLTAFVDSGTSQLVFSVPNNDAFDYVFIAMRAVVQTLPSTYVATTARSVVIRNDSRTNTSQRMLPARNVM